MSETWTIYLHKRALKFLQRRTDPEKQRLKDKISLLAYHPHPGLDVKKLAGESNGYRLRVGTFRIIFFVHQAKGEIFIDDIDNRGQVYK